MFIEMFDLLRAEIDETNSLSINSLICIAVVVISAIKSGILVENVDIISVLLVFGL